jgi:hypothetical protein
MTDTNLDASAQIIEADTPCRCCGYSLRSLRLDGICPECGTPAEKSLGPEVLFRSDPVWVQRRAAAMRAILWGIIAYVAIELIQDLLPTSSSASVREIIWRARGFGIVRTCVVLFLAAAHWQLSQPSSSQPGSSRARSFYRIAIVLVAGSDLATDVLMFFPLPGNPVLAIAISWIAIVGVFIGSFGFFSYLRSLALRVPSDPLARSARTLFWTSGVVLTVFIGLVLWIELARPIHGLPNLFIAIYCAEMASLIITASLTMLLLARLRRRFMLAVSARVGSQ